MAATAILIVGDASTGKSTSAKTLSPAETFIINVNGKSLPFRGWKKNYTPWNKDNPQGNMITTDNADTIIKVLTHISEKMPHIKHVVIDDAQYVAANEFMRRANETGFSKFTEIGQNTFKIPHHCAHLRDDLFVFFLNHEDTDEGRDNMKVAKTIGKSVDKYIKYEGMFSIVLFTYKIIDDETCEYGFITNHDPRSTAKSPEGMFEEKRIKNDLQYVVEKIKEYQEGE